MNQQVAVQQPQNIVTLDEEKKAQQGLIQVESSRAVQEVQASLIIAKRFPRDEAAAQQKIMNACQRPGLAEVATYSYSRGGSEITGASIRLAEALAQAWGNLEMGWREIERHAGISKIQTYCWDKESNTRKEQTFDVKHIRDTKQGGKVLKDEREIYENNANNAARRLRACILAMIPGDIVEDALNQCEQTLKTKIDLTPARIASMLKGFESYGVTKAMIEARIQRKLESITPAQFFGLGKVANSLKDGMSEPKDWFTFEQAAIAAPTEKGKAPAAQPSAEAENKDQLEGFKEKQKAASASKAKPEPHKPTQVSKPYTPAAQPTACENCKGRGLVSWEKDGEEGTEPCPQCSGSGKEA